jgi:hypothetical protein
LRPSSLPVLSTSILLLLPLWNPKQRRLNELRLFLVSERFLLRFWRWPTCSDLF